MSESESSGGLPAPVDDLPADLEHVTVENEAAPDACTLYPRDVDENEMATRWMTAEEGSFVSLAERR